MSLTDNNIEDYMRIIQRANRKELDFLNSLVETEIWLKTDSSSVMEVFRK